MSEITPGSVMSGFWRWFGVGVFVLIVLAALILGGWQAGWWFSNQDINRQTRQIQNSDSNQRALASDLLSQISNVENATVQMDGTSGQQRADLHAQRLGFARLACADAAQISSVTVLGDNAPAWIKANCLAGTVSPGSSLEK